VRSHGHVRLPDGARVPRSRSHRNRRAGIVSLACAMSVGGQDCLRMVEFRRLSTDPTIDGE
jgi:hypothetical protein